MRPKSLALLLLALGCGLVASIGITEVLAKRNAEPAVSGETQAIFVAMTEIPLGDLVSPQMIKLEQWPKDKVPQGAISKLEDIEGRRTRTKLYEGEPILENRLLGKGASEQGATALIPKGYRVVPVKVDLVSGGSSMIVPGDRVDVLVHLVRDPAREIQETVTRTILQDIKVFAVNDVVDLEKEKEGTKTIAAKTISLLVTPDQAAKLMLATQMGSVNLVMRSPEDDQQVTDSQARPSELFGGQAKSTRDKESLMGQDGNLQEKAENFLDFLGKPNGKKDASATTGTAEKAAPQNLWIMRILKPEGVQDVEFESQGTPDTSAVGAWKTTTMAAGPGGVKMTENQPAPLVEPPAPGPVVVQPDPNQPPPQ